MGDFNICNDCSHPFESYEGIHGYTDRSCGEATLGCPECQSTDTRDNTCDHCGCEPIHPEYDDCVKCVIAWLIEHGDPIAAQELAA